MKSSKKSEAQKKAAAAPKTTAAPAVKEEGKSRAIKSGTSTEAPRKGEKPERAGRENVTPVGKETPLSSKPRKDASKGSRQETKRTKGSKTEVVTKMDVGFGNRLFIRGSGAGLSWDHGVALECIGADEWTWASEPASQPIEFKLLINDDTWSQGENFSAQPGQRVVCHPTF